MKGLTAIAGVFILALGAVSSHAANVDRISTETGVSAETLQAERASTGLGWGSLENAHLLANASGQSFDSIVALHQSGEGWGKIAHDNGLNPQARKRRSPVESGKDAFAKHATRPRQGQECSWEKRC